ncbi:endonuclease MutS2 [Thermoanaerobacterium sp. RBIITD]|uniref:endonuclease MutS2 n=1 Tax=Thermoanaerobacterium sp. RBIITD TaxID=1550240 RepID=UPI000BB7EBE4|nr:endonuclease MutS2 [Thermoanaerobacterium sp. RBIITD]SNX52819.1 DNA mismatch repair protein MutS2 [Thermoanaerobacterium sp. RBIITD]
MEDKYYKNLEYDKIINFIVEYCDSETGKEKALNIKPYNDINIALKELDKVNEAISFISSYGDIDFSFKNISDILNKARINSTLNAGQLLKISRFLSLSGRVKAYLRNKKDENSYPLLSEYNSRLTHLKDFNEKIDRIIISEDEISDDASPLLKDIRRQKVNINNKIRDTLNSIITSSSKELQDPIITVRDGRYVVPVKQEYRGTFKGIIHDQSSSGATLFIEPMQVVELNNDLRQVELKEQQEIERILIELTKEVSDHVSEIHENMVVLTELDIIFAKAKYSIKTNATKPLFNTNRYINLKNARHPLLPPDKVVPINVYLGDEFDTLVITGPNTGGKTVTLKTIGLLTLMAMTGLNIPADEGSEIAFFDDIFVDIGDEQSIEQSLSTFSAHMTNIVKILDSVSNNSLVLLDELGAGTDPIEGAALAMSILDFLHRIGARTIATTHYSELKQYALKMDGVENASVEFDVETLRPTYKLTIGIPGKSNAFEISRRLGLREDVIDNAKNYITGEVLRFEDIIKDLEEKRIEAERSKQEIEQLKHKINEIKEEYEKKKRQTEAEKDRILEKAREKAKKILDNARIASDEIISKLREAEKSDRKNKLIEEARQKLKENISDLENGLTKTKVPTYTKIPKNIMPGQSVYIVPLDQTGTALSSPDKDGNVKIQAGILKMNVHISNLREAESQEEKDIESGFSTYMNEKSSSISTSIDLRGKNLEDAELEVDKYIDDAYLAGLKQVTIIHGKGTGTLRSGITRLLRQNKHVKSYRLGRYGEGEDGVTIVEIKEK